MDRFKTKIQINSVLLEIQYHDQETFKKDDKGLYREIYDSRDKSWNRVADISVDGYGIFYYFDSECPTIYDISVIYFEDEHTLFIGGRYKSLCINMLENRIIDAFEHIIFHYFTTVTDHIRHIEYVLELGELNCLLREKSGYILALAEVEPPYDWFIEENGIRFYSPTSLSHPESFLGYPLEYADLFYLNCMDISIANKRMSLQNLEKKFPGSEIVDVTSRAKMPWVKFSPFYPHGNIPVPYSDLYSQSVEGIWQGLKVFENSGVDMKKFDVKTMKGLKRTVRSFGKVLGHQKGIHSEELLNYLDARYEIYLPSYLFVLENYLQDEVNLLRDILTKKNLVFLDYEVNSDIKDLSKPLSHAYLVKLYLQEEWPKNFIPKVKL
jgi:hypothetical protein